MQLIHVLINVLKSNETNNNIYTSISIASISIAGRMKFIPRWTALALSPRKGTENTYDVRNSRYFSNVAILR